MPGESNPNSGGNGRSGRGDWNESPALKRQRTSEEMEVTTQLAERPLRRGGRRVSPDRRACLSKAFKRNIEPIIDTVFFRESRLPDVLVSKGCLTEDECRSIRERPDRKDQVRSLLVIIRGRDFRVMEHLLECIHTDNTDLANKIRQCYDNNLKSRVRDRRCVRCKLKELVNVKYVADRLFSTGYMSERLYNRVVYIRDSPTGSQDDFWDTLLQEIDSSTDPLDALDQLKDVLRNNKHYEHLANHIDRSTSQDHKLYECACHVNLRHASTNVFEYSNGDSIEPWSSDGSNGQSELSVEYRSRDMGPRRSRPRAMLISSDQLETLFSEDEPEVLMTKL